MSGDAELVQELPGQARKNDRGKHRFDLLPTYPLRKLVEVYMVGAEKYAPHGWRKGMAWSRIYSAMLRHATAWLDGEENDPVDGQHHLAAVAWCAFTLMEFEKTHPELDDRYKGG